MTTKVDKRRREIMNILNKEGIVYVREMANLFKVTQETIRGDMDFFVESYGEAVKRLHGAIRKEKQELYNQHYKFQDKREIHIEEKKRIAYKAVDFIDDGDCIYADSGSTVSCLTYFLDRKKYVTVVTPSVAIIMNYIMNGFDRICEQNHHELVFVGGHIHRDILTSHGFLFDAQIDVFNFDKMFLSVDAIDLKEGLTDADEISYMIAKKAAKRSHVKIVMADQSKFGYISNYRAFDFKQVDYLITDKALNPEWDHLFKKNQIQYVKV